MARTIHQAKFEPRTIKLVDLTANSQAMFPPAAGFSSTTCCPPGFTPDVKEATSVSKNLCLVKLHPTYFVCPLSGIVYVSIESRISSFDCLMVVGVHDVHLVYLG